ncbi:MAG: 2-isopropylmalate synthase, partial [Anaerolineae bacterium]|nr:2-isopropylmalate synthase [Gemmatimonadaceae bacterium]
QCPSVTNPPIEDKLSLLHLMVDLGIQSADIGLPGAGPRAYADTLAVAREIATQKLPLAADCAARTVVADIEPIARISQEVGIPIEVAAFIGSSPIRRYAEDWTIDKMLRVTEEAVKFCVREGLPVFFVTEDTTRASPDVLTALYSNAIRWGARRLCIADTVGHATPAGVHALVRFVKDQIIEPSGERVLLDWHGHRDRGLGLANSLAAIEAGVDRVHATAMGIGERVGNTEMDLLLINLSMLGAHRHDLSRLPAYVSLASRSTGIPIAASYPVMGEDAFRTATGVHAAAIIKARKKGHSWLADRVYSAVPAGDFGLTQKIEVGPSSGLSNVRCWLQEHGYDEADDALCQHIFRAAKSSDHTLSEAELVDLIAANRLAGQPPAGT